MLINLISSLISDDINSISLGTKTIHFQAGKNEIYLRHELIQKGSYYINKLIFESQEESIEYNAFCLGNYNNNIIYCSGLKDGKFKICKYDEKDKKVTGCLDTEIPNGLHHSKYELQIHSCNKPNVDNLIDQKITYFVTNLNEGNIINGNWISNIQYTNKDKSLSLRKTDIENLYSIYIICLKEINFKDYINNPNNLNTYGDRTYQTDTTYEILKMKEIDYLKLDIRKNDGLINSLKNDKVENHIQIDSLKSDLSEKDIVIKTLKRGLSKNDIAINSLEEKVISSNYNLDILTSTIKSLERRLKKNGGNSSLFEFSLFSTYLVILSLI